MVAANHFILKKKSKMFFFFSQDHIYIVIGPIVCLHNVIEQNMFIGPLAGYDITLISKQAYLYLYLSLKYPLQHCPCVVQKICCQPLPAFQYLVTKWKPFFLLYLGLTGFIFIWYQFQSFSLDYYGTVDAQVTHIQMDVGEKKSSNLSILDFHFLLYLLYIYLSILLMKKTYLSIQ